MIACSSGPASRGGCRRRVFQDIGIAHVPDEPQLCLALQLVLPVPTCRLFGISVRFTVLLASNDLPITSVAPINMKDSNQLLTFLR